MSDDGLNTSAEWQALHPASMVADPDGWDRTNFKFSWFEERITEDEYKRRRAQSTVWHREVS